MVMQARLVRALKRLTIDKPPNVLVFQLKRFEYMFHGSKITKKVRKRLLSCQPDHPANISCSKLPACCRDVRLGLVGQDGWLLQSLRDMTCFHPVALCCYEEGMTPCLPI